MIFGLLPLGEAEGAILAHSHRIAGRMLRKGARLDREAIAGLAAAGLAEVTAARLEPGDIGEDLAAELLAEALLAPGLTRSPAGTGRVNLHAEHAGLLRLSVPGVERLNRIDEALTLATLADGAVVAPHEMVATVKIIPFAVPGEVLAIARALARQGGPMFALHPFRPLAAGLVLTRLPHLKPSVLEKTVAATGARVAALGGRLLGVRTCAHETAALAACLRDLLAEGAELLLIAGASAVVDRRDVAPAAIVAAGGTIDHFGLPVDPGNLLTCGHVGAVPAVVLPGCARSIAPNGIDLVLPRIFAGLAVDRAEIARLAVGGLLKEAPAEARPLPRAQAPGSAPGPAPAAGPGRREAAVTALVLAAGRSRRAAPLHKLLVPVRGKPMIARTVDNVLASRARPVLVVLGHEAETVAGALAGRPVGRVIAADHAEGLAASLRAGLAAVPAEARGVIVCLGDMPFVTGRVIDRLIEAFDPGEGRTIVIPTFRGKRGNPVLWDRRFLPEMMALSGDAGARALLERHHAETVEVEMENDAVLRDFDTPEALAALAGR
ncbi:MAG: NTP transferase domain-containing protein [Acetobacteraceae bacterium]